MVLCTYMYSCPVTVIKLKIIIYLPILNVCQKVEQIFQEFKSRTEIDVLYFIDFCMIKIMSIVPSKIFMIK